MSRKPEPEPNATSRAVTAEIRGEIARRKLEQQDVAAKMSRGKNYLSRRLHDERSLTLTDIAEIAEALGVDLLTLMRNALSRAEAAAAAEAERRLREEGRTDGTPDQNG